MDSWLNTVFTIALAVNTLPIARAIWLSASAFRAEATIRQLRFQACIMWAEVEMEKLKRGLPLDNLSDTITLRKEPPCESSAS